MNAYEVYDHELSQERPMNRVQVTHSILYDVTQFELSDWTVDAEKANLVRHGFVVTDVVRSYDPMVGYKTEYWGFRRGK